MITREVISPLKPSRLVIVGLIALVAATGAIACASFVAGERDATFAMSWSERLPLTILTPSGYSINSAFQHDLTILTADPQPDVYALDPYAPALIRTTTIALAIVTQDTTYEVGVTLPDGTHHDVVVCPGGNPWPVTETRTCTTYDEARTP